MKKEPFYFNEEKHKAELQKLDYGKAELQKLVDAYSKLTEMPSLEGDEFKELYLRPENFMALKLIEKHNVSFNGMQIKTSKFFDTFEKPEGMDEFILVRQAVWGEISGFEENSKRSKYEVQINLSEFELIDGKIEIRKDSINEIKESCSYYLKTKKQIEANDRLNAIADNLNRLRILFNGDLDIGHVLKKCYGVDIINHLNYARKNFEVEPAFIMELE